MSTKGRVIGTKVPVKSSNTNKQVAPKEPAVQLVALCDLARAKLYTLEVDPARQTDKIIRLASVLQKIISGPFLELVKEGSTSFEINIDFEDASIVVQSTIESLTGFDGNLSQQHVDVLKTMTIEDSEDLSKYLTKVWKGQVIVERITLEEGENDEDEEMNEDIEDGGHEEDEIAGDEQDEDLVDIEDDDELECVNDGITMTINLF